jgi:CubicO group peptidase (beta-lactamase class C family)
MNFRWVISLVLIAIHFTLSACAQESRPWPAEEWDTATPASQQVDSAPLDALHREFESGEHGNIDGMSVYRNGYLVYQKSYVNDYDELSAGYDKRHWQYNYYDASWHPWFERGPLHTMQSISKSVTSALIGIAIGRGEIPGVDAKMMPYFADYEPVDSDPRRDAITIHDLLTMTAGIRWDESSVDYTDPQNSSAAMESSEDWVEYVLGQPMRAAPGEEFEYNSGITVLLAHILVEATGKDTDAYAMEHLFGPLGIDSFYWKKTPTGLVDTEGGLYLEPDDLARIGYLYANDGVWNGRRILPEGWVAASMTPHAEVPDWYPSYGYQWWLIAYEGEQADWAYTGLGYGGQRLLVVPEYDLIAVFTGWNIYDIPSLDAKFALERVLQSVQ